jgi:hypothetical protein
LTDWALSQKQTSTGSNAKVDASVVAVRRVGAIHVFNTMNHFFFISQMIVPGLLEYWDWTGAGGSKK